MKRIIEYTQALLSSSNRANCMLFCRRMYHKATNAAVCGQWAIKHSCEIWKFSVMFPVRDIVQWSFVTSQNIPRFDKAWKMLSIYIFAIYIFDRSILTPRKLISGIAECFCYRRPWRIGIGNCDYRRPNITMGNSNGTDNDNLSKVNMMFQ